MRNGLQLIRSTLNVLMAALMLCAMVLYTAQASDIPKEILVGPMKKFNPYETRKPVPSFTFTDAKGQSYTLADFKGKVLLVNFWATWCAPCRKEMPDLDKLQGQMGGDGFDVLIISQDRGGFKKIDKFLNSINVTHLHSFWDESRQSARKMRAMGLPFTVLIDKKGQLVGQVLGITEWYSGEAMTLINYLRQEKG